MAKFCGKCGAMLDPDTGRCPNCEPAPASVEAPTPEKGPTSKHRRRWWVFLVVLPILCLGGVLLFSHTNVTQLLCVHDWCEADCTTPRTCKLCGKTDGDPIGHVWENATCTAPQTCSVCGATTGYPLGHTPGNWEESIDISAAKLERKQPCARCGQILDSKAENLDSFSKNSVFIFTPRQFYERLVPLVKSAYPSVQYSLQDMDFQDTSNVLVIHFVLDDYLEYLVSFTGPDNTNLSMTDADTAGLTSVSLQRYRLLDVDNGETLEPIPGEMLNAFCKACDPLFSDEDLTNQILMQVVSLANIVDNGEKVGYNTIHDLLYAFQFSLLDYSGQHLECDTTVVFPYNLFLTGNGTQDNA